MAVAAIAALEPLGASRELAAAYAHLATLRMLARDLIPAQQWADRALSLTAPPGDAPSTPLIDPESTVIALQARGSARILSGDVDGCEDMRRAVALAAGAGLDGELGRAYANLVSATGEARFYDRSGDAVRDALDYFESHDLDSYAGYTRAWHARCLFEQGQWAEAQAELDALTANETQHSQISTATGASVLGRLRARRGSVDCWAPLDEALAIARKTGSLQRLAPVLAARAEASWLSGNAQAPAELLSCYELAVERGHPWIVGELGLWLHRHGMLARLPDLAAAPYRLHVNGNPVAAGQAWLSAGCPYEAADAWCDSDDSKAVTGALAIFARLGAEPGRARAARQLRSLGVRTIPRGPRRATAQDPDGLTPRQREVSSLVAAGLTDAQIAARLHLSVKTVGHHVSAVLVKTQSTTRRDLYKSRDV
jgi:DNA-binding CsgD family transcriptional regulator